MHCNTFILISLSVVLSVFSCDAGRKFPRASDLFYCESWKFTVENNDAGKWSTVPSRCEEYVKSYMTGPRYLFDSSFVADDSISYARNITITGDGLDSWVFDIDETLLSNLPYYADRSYGSDALDVVSFLEWEEKAMAPPLPASLILYDELQKLNFTIFLLTGRSETLRNATVQNLLFAGYRNWQQLIMREESDRGKTAAIFKHGKRMDLESQGYRILGNSGDQWSDLEGNTTAVRSFKLPNPMYYIA